MDGPGVPHARSQPAPHPAKPARRAPRFSGHGGMAPRQWVRMLCDVVSVRLPSRCPPTRRPPLSARHLELSGAHCTEHSPSSARSCTAMTSSVSGRSRACSGRQIPAPREPTEASATSTALDQCPAGPLPAGAPHRRLRTETAKGPDTTEVRTRVIRRIPPGPLRAAPSAGSARSQECRTRSPAW